MYGKNKKTRNRYGRWVQAAFLLALTNGTALQAQTGADAEELRRRSQSEAEERLRQQQAPDVRLTAPAVAIDPDALDLPDEKPCFQIQELRIEGESLGQFTWIQPWLNRYADRCIGREGIELIMRRLSARIIAQGYVTTRVGLPEQNLSSGVLTFQLFPGRIRAVRFADPETKVSWRTVFPARPGDLLNLRDIEQGLEQLKRIASQDANIDIAPGDVEGESDIVITLKQTRPWRLTLAADDAGSKATGRRQGSVTLALDNPLNLNDLITATLNADLANDPHNKGTDGHSLMYSIPWGYWTFQASTGYWSYRQTIQGVNQTFLYSGDSRTTELRVQRLLHRDQTSKTSLLLRTHHRAQTNAINHIEIEAQNRRTTAAELGLIHRHYLGNAQLDLTLAYREGVPWFGGIDDASNRTHDMPTWRYKLQTLDAALLVPFQVGSQPLRWNSALRLQHTDDRLYVSDYFSIGGRYTVRGFDGERTLAAERGGYWRNDLEFPFGDNNRHAFYAGVDHGWVSGPGARILAGRQLTGAVLGLRGSFPAGAEGLLGYEFFAGKALHKPDGFETANVATGFQLSLQY